MMGDDSSPGAEASESDILAEALADAFPMSPVGATPDPEPPQESVPAGTLRGVKPPAISDSDAEVPDVAVPRLGDIVFEPVEEDTAGKTLTLRRTMFGLPTDSAVGAEATDSGESDQTRLGLPGIAVHAVLPGPSSTDDDMAPTLLMTPEKLDAVSDTSIPAVAPAEEPPAPEESPPQRKSGSITLFGMKAAELQLAMQDHTETPHAVVRPSDEEEILSESDTAEFNAIPAQLETGSDDFEVITEPAELRVPTPDPFGLDHALGGLTSVTPADPPALEPTAPPHLEPTAPPYLEPTAPPYLEPTAPPYLEPTAPPHLEPVARSAAATRGDTEPPPLPGEAAPAAGVRIQSVASLDTTGPGFSQTERMPVVTPRLRDELVSGEERMQRKARPSYAMTGSEVREYERRVPTPAFGSGVAVAGSSSGSAPAAWSAPRPVVEPVAPPKKATGGAIRLLQFLAGAVLLGSTFLPFEGSVWEGTSGGLWSDIMPIALGLVAVALSVPHWVPRVERLLLGFSAAGAAVMLVKDAGTQPFDVGGQIALRYILFLLGSAVILLLGLFAIRSSGAEPDLRNKG